MIIFIIVISFILGANLYLFFPLIFIPLSIGFFIFVFYRFHLRGLIFCLISFGISVTISSILNNIEPTKDSYDGIVIEAKDNYYILSSFPYRFYIYEKNNDVEVGDILSFKGKPIAINKTTYESQFDFNAYLKGKNVRFQLSSYSKKVISKNVFHFKRERQKFLSNFDTETKYVIDSILFGNNHSDSSIYEAAKSINIIYLFSLSGIYVSFLLRIIKKICRRYINNKIIADSIPLIILIPYMPFVLLKIGCLRATITYIFRFINEHVLHKKFSNLEVLSLSALVLLIVDYTFAYQMGFYLGYFLGVFIYFLGMLYEEKKKDKFGFLFIPFLLYLFLLPVSSFQNGEFHLFQLLFQNLLLPINEGFLAISLLSFLIYPFPNILNFLSRTLLIIYRFFNNIDLSLPLGEFNVYLITFYYVAFILIIYFYEEMKEKRYMFLTIMLTTIFFIKAIPIRAYLYNAIYFINVGQGDSILIVNHNHNVLIDTGGNTSFDMAKETLIPFFHKKQIFKIDYLITTHDDFDHAGAAPSLMKNFKVSHYLKNREDFPIKVGDIYLDNLNNMESSDENDSSLVFNLEFMNQKFLLTGDASTKVEKYLLEEYPDLDCDILKVGHHGSNTSTSEEFIKKITPKEAIISVSSENRYGHPSQSVIDTLNKYKVNIRYTMKEGTIAYVSI